MKPLPLQWFFILLILIFIRSINKRGTTNAIPLFFINYKTTKPEYYQAELLL